MNLTVGYEFYRNGETSAKPAAWRGMLKVNTEKGHYE
jgi:hypothetical protein